MRLSSQAWPHSTGSHLTSTNTLTASQLHSVKRTIIIINKCRLSVVRHVLLLNPCGVADVVDAYRIFLYVPNTFCPHYMPSPYSLCDWYTVPKTSHLFPNHCAVVLSLCSNPSSWPIGMEPGVVACPPQGSMCSEFWDAFFSGLCRCNKIDFFVLFFGFTLKKLEFELWRWICKRIRISAEFS